MATRSRIGIENQDGTVNSIYCHFDGYPSHNGEILKEYYSDREKLQQLLELGDISSLDRNLDRGNGLFTIAYHRDRGEELNPARIDKSLDEFRESDYEEYGYIFTLKNKWLIFN
jgi:hypothetical protein